MPRGFRTHPGALAYAFSEGGVVAANGDGVLELSKCAGSLVELCEQDDNGAEVRDEHGQLIPLEGEQLADAAARFAAERGLIYVDTEAELPDPAKDLLALSRADLEEQATAAGVSEPEGFKNKGELADAVVQARARPAAMFGEDLRSGEDDEGGDD